MDLQKGLVKGAGSVIAEGTPDLPLIAADLHSSATAHASVKAERGTPNKRGAVRLLALVKYFSYTAYKANSLLNLS